MPFWKGDDAIMGEADIEILLHINMEVRKICQENDLPFRFKTDDGDYETAIEFWAMGYHHPPKSQSWEESKKQGNEIKCPDLLDYPHKLIIEFEEESTPNRGPKIIKKGHTEESRKDSRRDQLYRMGGFKLLKIWEFDYKSGLWRQQLKDFLKNEM